jgi:peptidoglycan hydrolase-like protein with peptidoglycan-binding domain
LRGQHDQGAASSTPPPPVWSASSTWPTPPPTSHEPSGTPIMTGSSTCMNFPRNLSLGSQGSDVSDLQTMLSQDPSVYPSGAVTGYFGPLTAKAVVQFQEKNDIASSSAGYVGPLTRNFFMKHCGPGPVLPPFTPTNGSSTRPSGTPPYPPMPEHMGSSTFPLPPPPPWTMNGSSTGPGPNGPGNPSGTPPYPIPMPPPHPHPTASSTLTY